MPGLKASFRLIFFCCLAFVDRPAEARVIKIASGINTISSAVNIAATGDTLLLVSDGGSYHESSWIAVKHASLTLMAAPDLDSPPIWTSDGDRHIRLYGNLTAKGIHFDGRNKADYAIKSYAPQPNNIWIENCVFSNIVKDAITDDDIPVHSCRVFHTRFFNIGGTGVEFKTPDMCYNVEVSNCTFVNMGEHAIHVEEKEIPLKVRISNITVHNSISGVYFNNVRDGVLTKSILTGSRSYAIRSTLPATVTYICTYQNVKNYENISPGTGCLDTNPLYFEPEAHNFSLLPGSPGLDTPVGAIGDLRWTGPSTLHAIRNKQLETWGFYLSILLLAVGLITALGYGVHRQTLHNERKRVENQIRQSQKLETLGHLAGGIAHDFNNLIAIISGNAEIISEYLSSNNKLRDNIEEILRAASRSQDLVKQLTAFNSGDEPEHRPVKLNPLLDDALSLIQSVLPSNLALQKDIGQDIASILRDPTQINQVILNLCLNAKDAMAESGGTLSVSLYRTQLGINLATKHGLAPGPYAQIVISDTGHGMTRQVQKHIFEPFFTTKPKDEGTGLGLSVVQSVIQRHNGTITVSSQVGTGTTFYVYLPIPDETTSASKALVRPTWTKARILFVDDEADLAQVCKELLEQQGHEVVSKTDSREALKIFQNEANGFDLIVTDYLMPHLDGGEFIRRVKTIRADIPVILITGLHTQINAHKASQMGFEGYLAKPRFSQDLGGVVQKILSRAQN